MGGAGGGEEFDDAADSVMDEPANLSIGVEEMRDTLLFYVDKDAAQVASERDMRRTMGPLRRHGCDDGWRDAHQLGHLHNAVAVI